MKKWVGIRKRPLSLLLKSLDIKKRSMLSSHKYNSFKLSRMDSNAYASRLSVLRSLNGKFFRPSRIMDNSDPY